MENQNNQRIVETPRGSLLIRKGVEDGELCVKFSTIFDIDNDGLFVEPKVTMSFDDEEKRDKAYNASDVECAEMFDDLLKTVKEAIS